MKRKLAFALFLMLVTVLIASKVLADTKWAYIKNGKTVNLRRGPR